MTTGVHLAALGYLVDRGTSEQDRLSAELARQQGVRERYMANMERLKSLCDQAGPTGALVPVLAANGANYKQTVMGMVGAHEEALLRHETEMRVTREALYQAVRKREALDQLLQRGRRELQAQADSRARKSHDEVAIQAWSRRLP